MSGGSEAIETALKLARAYHLARGEPDRWIVYRAVGELPRQHPRRARPVRAQAAAPAVRGLARPVPARLGGLSVPGRLARARTPSGTADELAAELDRAFEAAGPGTVAAFVAEPIVGATLAAVVPPDGYWPAIAEVCRRHGVLLIADEVMTGFGRTGRWFALDHWGVRPDILVAAKGASSGYWPFGFVAASDEVYAAVTGGPGFVHGFTYSHAPVGAAVAREVLRILETESLVEASAAKGERLLGAARRTRSATTRRSARSAVAACWSASSWSPTAATREPFPRAARVTEAVVRGARERGVLVYSGTGNANGVDGDTILLGPPFVVTDAELERIAAVAGRRRSRRSPRHRRGRRPAEAVAGSDERWPAGPADRGPPAAAPAGQRRRARRGRSAGCSPPNDALAMLPPPISASRPPNQSCQPHAAAATQRGRAAMNRKATPKLNVLRPSASIPAALSRPGTASAVMIAPA